MKSITGNSISSPAAFAKLWQTLAAAVLTLCLGACGIEKPEAPSWDAEFVLPLINHHYDMIELVDRMAEDGLSYDSLGNLTFSVERQIDTVSVAAALRVSDLTEEFCEMLGPIELSTPEAISEVIHLMDHFALSGDVPELTIDTSQYFPTIPDIERAMIESGSMLLTATNNLDIPIDTFVVTIIDSTFASVIGAANFEGGLDIGETESISIDLSGKTVSSSFMYNAHLHTPGGTILSSTGKNVELGATFPETITISSATAIIPTQEKSYSREISFPDDNRITVASIKDGVLEISLTNGTNLSSSVNVTIEELTSNGTPLSLDAELSAQQTSIITHDLSGYELRPLPDESSPTIRVSVDVSLPGSGTTAVEIASTDSVGVDVQVSDLDFSYISGILAPTVVEIEPVTKTVDVPDAFEGFNLTGAVMILDLCSAVNVPGQVSVRLEGDAGQQIEIASAITPGTVENPGLTVMVVEDLTDLLSPIPSEITITGSATVGDGATQGSVTEDDVVWGDVKIISPLEMSVSPTEFKAAINSASIDPDIESIIDDLNHGTVNAQITNHLPLGASITLYLGARSTDLYENPDITIGPIDINSATVGSNGLVSDPVVSQNEIRLTHDDLAILSNSTVHVGQIITLPGTNGQSVRIVSTDYIDVQAYITVNARVNAD